MKPTDRLSYRMFRLRKDRLGDDRPDLSDSWPPKPRWMRWRTYKRLAAIDENTRDQWAALAIQRLLKYARP